MLPLRQAQNILSVEDIINTAHLRRWHMIKVDREQTLAEHMYLVAMLSTKMFYDCTYLNWASGAEDDEQIQRSSDREIARSSDIARMLLAESLLHDMHEINSGDIPANPVARARVKELTGGLEIDKLIQEDYWTGKAARRGITESLTPIPDPIRKLVSVADKLEAMTFYALNGDPRTYNALAIANGTVNAVIRTARDITPADETALCLTPGALIAWVATQLKIWAVRFGPNFGHQYKAAVLALVADNCTYTPSEPVSHA